MRSAAVDLGASSGRVLLGSVKAGRIALQECVRFRTPTLRDAASGYQCWDIDRIVAEVRTGIESCAAELPLHSLGVDSWAVDFVLLNEQMERVAPAVCYREKHTNGMADAICAHMPAEEIYRRTGIQFQPFNTLYQLAGLAKHQPQWLASARRLLMFPDYLHFRLCGVAKNEYTNASTTQMLALDGAWDAGILNAAGLDAGPLSQPIDAGSLLGNAQIGRTFTQVIAPATHDTASAVVGTPLEDADEAYISSGTWSLMGIETPEPIATREAMRMNFTNEGGYRRRFRVLKNIMGMWPLQRMCDECSVACIDTLIREAEAAQAWRSLINLDDPAFLNPQNMTESLRQYCSRTGQPEPSSSADLARCILDSLALSYGRVKQQIEELRGAPLSRIRIVGGGSRNRLLNQLTADACGLPVSAGPVEASALGNLAVQWIALGAIEDVNEARAMIRNSFPCEQFVPKSCVQAAVWDRFEQLTRIRFAEDMKCI